MTDHKHNVLFITNFSGAGGGAEQQLQSLVAGVDKQKFQVTVVSLYYDNFGTIEVPGAQFICLNRSGKFDFLPMLKVMRILRKNHIEIIQPFLSPATLFGIVPAFLVRTPIKVITERCGLRKNPGWGYKVFCTLEDLFGRRAQVAVANSGAGQSMLIERGYKPKKTMVIYNGLVTRRLEVDPARVLKIREETGLKPEQPVVGIAAWVIPHP